MESKNIAGYLKESIAGFYNRAKHAKDSIVPGIAAALFALALAGEAKASENNAYLQNANNRDNTAKTESGIGLLESRISRNPENELGIKGFKIDKKCTDDPKSEADKNQHTGRSQESLSAIQSPIIYPAHAIRPAYRDQSRLIPPSTKIKLPQQIMLRKNRVEDLAETAAALYAAFLFKTINHEEGHGKQATNLGIGHDLAIDIGGVALASDSGIGKELSLFSGRAIYNGRGFTGRQDLALAMGGFNASQNAYENITRILEKGEIDPDSPQGKFLRFSRFLAGIDFLSYYIFNPPGTDYNLSDINALDEHGLGKSMKMALAADALKLAGVSVTVRIPGTDYVWKFTPSAQYDPANGVMGPGVFSEITYKTK